MRDESEIDLDFLETKRDIDCSEQNGISFEAEETIIGDLDLSNGNGDFFNADDAIDLDFSAE